MQQSLTSTGDNTDERERTTSTNEQEGTQRNSLAQGRGPLPSIMAASVTALPAGRRTSSPAPRPASPANGSFQPSSSQQPGLTTANNITKTAGRFSDAFSTIVGRSRTASIDSIQRDLAKPSSSNLQAQESKAAEGSFGIDDDPFAGRPLDPPSHLPSDPSSASQRSTSIYRKQRGSFLVAASDVLGFTRVGASITKRMSKRGSVERSAVFSASQDQPLSQQRRGLPWKGKGKPKGHWAFQPSSLHSVTDVIEISAANSALTSVRDEEEENERKERDRLREAAAESIGISPLFREDASSRVTGNDDDNSTEEHDSRDHHEAGIDADPSGTLRALDRSRTSLTSTPKQYEKPPGLHIQQMRDNRHNRSSSLSGITTPTTPTVASHWPLPPLGPPNLSANGRALKGSVTTTNAQQLPPPFPCPFSALNSSSSKSSTVLKYFPSSSLLLGFSRQWRTRTIVLTTPPRPKSPSLRSFRPFTPPERLPSVCHLHLFKSSGPDERELERLEVNENSVVFVAEEEIAGKRSVVKVGGVDVGARKRELNVEENGQIMWLLCIADAGEAQDWITTLKSAVLDQRAEKAGFAMPADSSYTTGPRGDLDVMLSMRAQDLASTVRVNTQMPIRPSQDDSRARSRDSPTPTTRSWSGERRRPTSPSSRIVSLKGLFSVPGRARSMSHGSGGQSEEESPTSPADAPSFTSRGTDLLNMTPLPNGDRTSGDCKSAPSSPVPVSQALPAPNPLPGPILSGVEMNLDKGIVKERDNGLPEWYSIQNHQWNRGDSTSSLLAGPTLLPPPRNKRPWTSAGLLNNTKREQDREGSPPPRRSFQSAVSLHSARLSVDGKSRPSSPVESLGAATGAFGTVEVGPKRASLSSSVSSFVSAPDRDQLAGRSTSGIQRRMRAGKLPKMLTPPTGPPPSVPSDQQGGLSPASGEPNAQRSGDGSPSRSSSLRSMPTSDAVQNGSIFNNRRLSESSALSTGSASYISLRTSSKSLSPKRASIPPPPRPAPTTALPPTPPQGNGPKQNGSPRRPSFRETFSHRSLRFSLSPPPSKEVPSRSDDTVRRRSISSGGSVSSSLSHVSIAPPAPPPTGPLPPTPRDPIPNRYSIRERLRMKSAPSTPLGVRGSAGPPTTLPGSPPLVTVSSVASFKEDIAHPIPIGEPITAIPKDLNFLNMSSPVDSSAPSTDDADFLHVSTPLSTTSPKQIPGKPSDYPPPERSNGSPPTPEMTALPPPPRRGRNGTFSEKDRNRSTQSLTNNVALTTTDDSPSLHAQVEPVAAVLV